jgi:serine/threonine-protein phosphatase 6 regulatory subunit 3
VLDKESFTLEELLEEDDVIQECKSLNSRLVNLCVPPAKPRSRPRRVTRTRSRFARRLKRVRCPIFFHFARQSPLQARLLTFVSPFTRTNGHHVTSLKTKPVVEKLVSFMVDPPPADADARREFKYPYLACEIFCCELDAVFATLCEDECELFGRIVRFIDTDDPLPSMLAGYFGKVVGCVVARRAPETTRFFQTNPKYLRLLVRKIQNLAVAEVLLRLVGADDPGVSPMQGMLMSAIHGTDQTGWLAETTLLDQLLDALGEGDAFAKDDANEVSEASSAPSSSEDTATRRANAAEVLVGIARGAPSALADRLATANAMEKLFVKGLENADPNADPSTTNAPTYGSRVDGATGANDVDATGTTPPLPTTAHSGTMASPLVNVIDIAVAVLDAKRAAGPAQAMQAFLAAETGEAPPEPRRAPYSAVAACVRALPKLVAFLDLAGDASAQKTPWGEMTPPLGLKRVKVVDLVATLVSARSEAAAEPIVASGALPLCVQLFRRYPFNNFLHHHVERMCRDVLQWGHPALLAHLFEKEEAGGCDVVGVVTQAPRTVETARGPARAGNLGHITRLSNALAGVAAGANVEEAEEEANANADVGDETEPGAGSDASSDDTSSPRGALARARAATAFVKAKLETDPRWALYREGELASRNAVENTRAWRCGRPAGLDDPDDDDGDDDGDFDLGVGGGFSRDAYNRYGGSLEEEEEEDGEDERDIGFPGDDDDDHESDGDDDIDNEGGIGAGDGVTRDNSLVAAGIAAGLFQGDAGARLASLTLKNESYGQRVLDSELDANLSNLAVEGVSSDDADDAPTVPVPAFAGTIAGDADEDDVVLADEDVCDAAEDKRLSGTVVAVADADDDDADALVASEFGAVRYWGSSIDTSLVPDDV